MGVAARLARPHLRGGGGGGVVARRIPHEAAAAGCQQAAFLLERHQAGCHGQVLRVAQLFDLFLLLLLFLAFPVPYEPHDEKGGGGGGGYSLNSVNTNHKDTPAKNGQTQERSLHRLMRRFFTNASDRWLSSLDPLVSV